MFDKKTLIIVILLSHVFISVAAKLKDKLKDKVDKLKDKGKGKEKGKADEKGGEGDNKYNKLGKNKQWKAPTKIAPEKVEFAKTFFKNLIDDQKKGVLKEPEKLKGAKGGDDGGEDKILKASPGTVARGGPKTVPTGGTVFMDGLLQNVFPIGDPYGGLPDGVLAMAKYCVDFLIKGILVVIYTTVRYPHKILLKAMVLVGALIFLPNNILYCLSPLTMANFVQKSKIVNKKADELSQIQYEWKVRLANIVDRVHIVSDVMKLSCCGLAEFKRKTIEVTADEAKEFLASYYGSTVKIYQTIFCGEYQDGSPDCEGVEYPDEEPGRVIPRCWPTLLVEQFVKFF